jgi:6-phosphogluconate dehydrogenase
MAAFSASLSKMKDERVDASAVLTGPKAAPTGDRHVMIEELRKALYAAFILAYAEAYSLLAAAEAVRGGVLSALEGDGSSVASMAAGARSRCGARESLLLDAKMKSSLDPALGSLRRVCSRCVDGGLHAPGLLAAVSYYDGCRSTWLPTNMVAALRDAREGSGYERVDRPRGEVFHSDWK